MQGVVQHCEEDFHLFKREFEVDEMLQATCFFIRVESCVKISEASASVSLGDDGMNLLAAVAAGEISRSENASPSASPERKFLASCCR
ncbi:hypothetical protein E2542_SST06627 [Spatholobus suberectus]|nr:hypothetical protein E2542_SST06627 [Spatholobus suberectus]